MGQYSTYSGKITFKTKEAFDSFYKGLVENHWYNEEKNLFKADEPFDLNEFGGEINKEALSFTFPEYNINNYHRILHLIEANSWSGEIRWVTDDGCFEGGIEYPDGKGQYISLEEWAQEHGFDLEYDDEIEDYDTELRCDVMDAFLANPFPPSNSVKFITKD